MGIKNLLKEKLKTELTVEELSLLPRGFQTLGKAIILKLNPKLLQKKEIIGMACLELYPKIKSIYINQGKIQGTHRTPERIEYLVGVENPMVEHKENRVRYKFDMTKIMFSQGNSYERKLLATLVKPNEIIVDMFAGIGYFSLPIMVHSQAERIYSIEINPYAYKFLVENIKINHLEGKIVPILGDSKEEVLKLSSMGIKADRIIMGVFPAPKDFIKDAITLIKESGTIIHYEGVSEKENYLKLFDEFSERVETTTFKCELRNKRIIKNYGPHLYHFRLDILISKKKSNIF